MNGLIRLKKLERFILPALAAAYFGYLCLRAALLPMTTDECATWWNYVPDPVIDLLTYRDPIPNNHLLNTLLIKFFSPFFPVHQFTVRIPALLGGAAYLVAAVGIARQFRWAFPLQLLLFASLVGNHFVCDFLSLARGYGMSAGYVLLSIFFGLKFLMAASSPPQPPQRGGATTGEARFQLAAPPLWGGWGGLLAATLFWSALAVLASFTALNFFLPFCLYLAIVVFYKKLSRAYLLSIFSAIALVAAVCYLPFKRMAETDQFHFWSIDGFYRDTVVSIAKGFLYGEHRYSWLKFEPIAVSLVAIWAIWGIAALYLFFKKKMGMTDPLIFTWSILTATAATTILQAVLIKTPYLSGRTAVVFWPLFAFGLPFLVKLISDKFQKIGYAIALLLTIGITAHFLYCANLKATQEWWFDADSFKVLDYLKKIKDDRGDNKKITLSSYWLMVNSVAFEVEYNRTEDFEKLSYKTASDPDDPSEFVYTIRGELPVYEKNFEVIWEVEPGGRYLLRRRK